MEAIEYKYSILIEKVRSCTFRLPGTISLILQTQKMTTITRTYKINYQEVTLNLHIEDGYSSPSFVTNQEGKKVEGLWHWGTKGMGDLRTGRLEFDTREGTDGYLNIRTTASWNGGRNGRKYLVKIVEVVE